jgi:hypothetical protein
MPKRLRPPASDYQEKRRREMPSLEERVDALLEQANHDRLNGKPLIQKMDDVLGKVNAVKAKHKKPR